MSTCVKPAGGRTGVRLSTVWQRTDIAYWLLFFFFSRIGVHNVATVDMCTQRCCHTGARDGSCAWPREVNATHRSADEAVQCVRADLDFFQAAVKVALDVLPPKKRRREKSRNKSPVQVRVKCDQWRGAGRDSGGSGSDESWEGGTPHAPVYHPKGEREQEGDGAAGKPRKGSV